MPLSCHGAISQVKEANSLTVALAGNPNVGKSSVFNYLTGLSATTANYPGKTVEVNLGSVVVDGASVALIDLPGTYALGAVSEDQWVARRAVLDSRPDGVLAVVDATNLARNLYLVFQLMDLGLPITIALNLVDEAKRRGVPVDRERLSAELGAPVIETVATRGDGLTKAIETTVAGARAGQGAPALSYGEPVDTAVVVLTRRLESLATGALPPGFSGRALALMLLEEDVEVREIVRDHPWGSAALAVVAEIGGGLLADTREPAALIIPRRRHMLAARIARRVQPQPGARTDLFLKTTTGLLTGVPLMLAVLAATFAFLFYVGNLLSTGFGELWAAFVSPLIQAALGFVFGAGMLTRILLWGFDAGIQAALAVGIPYVLTFYFLLAILEDTGYLNSIAFLGDQAMRRLGLHGRAIIPLVAGAGCNVPAIIGTRVLATMRERTIASTLIVLVPCTARTAVILGALSHYVGWQPAAALYGVVAAVVVLVGAGLNRLMPGTPGGLVVEMFPFRWPHLATTTKKTWYRFKEFVLVAAPIVFGGSLLLGALYETGYIWALAAPLSPVVEGWLGLPAVAGLTLIFAVLRKELALQLLITLAIARYGSGANDLLSFMGPRQLFVYALVNTLYIPCAATIAAMGKELGWRRTIAITGLTVVLALVVGGLASRVLLALGWA